MIEIQNNKQTQKIKRLKMRRKRKRRLKLELNSGMSLIDNHDKSIINCHNKKYENNKIKILFLLLLRLKE